jgi:hypothetical protein
MQVWVGVLLDWLTHATLIPIIIVLVISWAGEILGRHDHVDVRTLL